MDKKELVYSFMCEKEYVPMKFKDIGAILQVPSDELEELGKCLDDLSYEYKIFKDEKGKYVCFENSDFFCGTFLGTGKGFGFLKCDDEKKDDIYIPFDSTNNALNLDKVIVKVTKKNTTSSDEGYVYKILKRNNQYVVGVLQINKKTVFLVPDNSKLNTDVYIKYTGKQKIKNGMKAVARIDKWPSKGKNATGTIVEILGFAGENEAEVMSVIRENKIRYGFTNEILREAEKFTLKEEDFKGREDFRNKTIITIDGEDAKDLDDAIGIEKNSDGYELSVHIADVSHYVTQNSAVDKEAQLRGTSVYFADRVIPMLPEALSNNLCSLQENKDRLTLSVVMNVGFDGKVKEYRIVKGIIKTKHRMTYTNVTKILDGDNDVISKYQDIYDDIILMNELSEILTKNRDKRGYINFNFPEARIIFDENKNVKDVVKREFAKANLIIEEFMLLCNETVAEFAFWNEIPFVYRVHEKPDSEKIEALRKILSLLGYSLKPTKEVYSLMLNEILKQIKGKPEEKVLNTMMLRSMMKAKYSKVNNGHFGLALKNYCHFTSPIRRYPDLLIHRIIKFYLDGKMDSKNYKFYDNFTAEASTFSSDAEVTATNAERTIEDMKKAEYMERFVGDSLEGVISSVTSFGIFVEFENTIEGLVRYADMKDDYYDFDRDTMSVIGEKKGKIYRIGDKVSVIVVKADRLTGQIDLVFNK